MSTGLGQLSEFRPGQDRLSVYLERFEMYIKANSVADEKKVPLFLTVIGPTVYSLLHDLFAPDSPTEKTYDELTEKLKTHFDPKPVNVLTHRHTFHCRSQGPNESIAEYMAELRRLAANCDFGTFLEQALRDRLVFGIHSESTQKQLLTQSDIKLSKVVELALSLEAAQKSSQSLKRTDFSSLQVHKLTPHKPHSSLREVTQREKPCYRCGNVNHAPSACSFREAKCRFCGKVGHIARVCKSKAKRATAEAQIRSGKQATTARKTNWVQSDSPISTPPDSQPEVIWQLGTDKPNRARPYQVVLEVNRQSLAMEIDTGAAVSLISRELKDKLFSSVPLTPSKLLLRTYTSESIPVLGEMNVEVKYGAYLGQHTLQVVEGSGPPLLGRDWLKDIHLDWASIRALSAHAIPAPATSPALQQLLAKYSCVFQPGLGTMKQRAHLSLREGSSPRFCRPRPVPFAIKEAVGKELDRLESAGILHKVDHSDWAAPIVPVPKKDGTIRVCGDYKVSVNPMLQVDQYPLPNPNELMASLANGKLFTKLDLTSAYQQMLLDKESAKLVTINTHQGLYECNRLPFGIASAPAVFQRAMDTILQGIPHVVCYLDDILVTGESEDQHLQHLEEVLQRLQENGIRLHQSKCRFFQPSVEYLGHCINSEGVHTSDSKVKAIVEAPAPRNVTELRSFLGLVNYYGKFVPNLASLLHPLHQLLRAETRWIWTKECQRSFDNAKARLVAAPVLTHFDPKLPIRMAGDASQYGIGAVISHIMPNGSERPIAYASRTLSSTEKKYAQVEKEALSLIFGVKRFHQFLYGKHFTLVTDHKPLTAILGPKKGIPPLAAARMQRWALLLSGYSYDIHFRPTTAHGNADCLSRLPLSHSSAIGNYEDASLFNICQVEALPIHAAQLMAATRSDLLLSKVLQYARCGWPDHVADDLRPFWQKREEIAVEGDCVMWGTRVIVPEKLRKRVIEELHKAHPGVVRMKALARSYVWWPGLDRQIEACAKSCMPCQVDKHSPPKAPLHPWAWPTVPWQRVHVDYAGPVSGKMLLIIVDAHSKWPEVFTMSTTTSSKTITKLRETFARFGLPEQLVSDNGPQFVSEEFETFLRMNGVKHIRSSPYHPASNGAAERVVQVVKQALRAGLHDSNSLEYVLSTFLMQYRSTPHATTGVSPSSLFLGRTLRTRLDLLKPDLSSHVRRCQDLQKTHHDQHSRKREFSIGQNVWVKNVHGRPRWISGIITEIHGPVSYVVRLSNGDEWRRHIDQLRCNDSSTDVSAIPSPDDDFFLPNTSAISDTPNSPPQHQAPVPRYPTRIRRPPIRYGQ